MPRLDPSAARQVFTADHAPHLVAYAHTVACLFPDPATVAGRLFGMSGPVTALTLAASGNVSIIEGTVADRSDFLYARGHRSRGWFRDRLHLLDVHAGRGLGDVLERSWTAAAVTVPVPGRCPVNVGDRDVLLAVPPVATGQAGVLVVATVLHGLAHGSLWTPRRGVRPGTWRVADLSERTGLLGTWTGPIPPPLPPEPRAAYAVLRQHTSTPNEPLPF